MTYPLTNSTPDTKKVETPENKETCQSTDREKYSGEIREKLNKIQSKVTSMKDEGSRLTGDLKKKADENLTKIDAKYTELKTKFDEFKYSTEEKWTAHKETFEKSFQELSTNFKGLFS